MGGGTCALLILLHERGLLAGRRWAVIEPGEKRVDDKTYCFWSEKLRGPLAAFEPFIENEWSQVRIDGHPAAALAPVHYRRIRSLSLYAKCRAIIEEAGGHWFKAQLQTASAPSTQHPGHFELQLDTGEAIRAQRVFDSRPPQFIAESRTDVLLLQSFVGYRVELQEPRNWDLASFHMMDFHVPQGKQGDTQFMYTLPEGPNSGLIELTRFGQAPIRTSEAAGILDAYILDHFGPYTIHEVETGGIPMCIAPMAHEALPVHPRWTAIGTRAGRVKPSTGYAFKSMVHHAHAMCLALETNPSTAAALPAPRVSTRFAFYDRLLLLILRDRPHRGKPIFQRLFQAKSAPFILRFLDESTTLGEEALMFAKLPISDFLRACWWRLKDAAFAWIPASAWLLAVAVMSWLSSTGHPSMVLAGNTALLLGLAVIGIPHGALDAVTGIAWGGQRTSRFYLRYLSIMAATLLLWWGLPTVAVTVFVGASIWHFGQGDAVAWNVAQRRAWTVAWGGLLFAFILGFHPDEVDQILSPLGIPRLIPGIGAPPKVLQTALWIGAASLGAAAVWRRQWPIFIALTALALTPRLPLLWAFGSYFVFHHSLMGWHHLRSRSGWSHGKLWRSGAPFTAGAFIFLIGGGYWAAAEDVRWGVLFALLSAISLPHILESHRFLGQKPNP